MQRSEGHDFIDKRSPWERLSDIFYCKYIYREHFEFFRFGTEEFYHKSPKKSSLHYTRGIPPPKRVTSSGARFHRWAPRQLSFEVRRTQPRRRVPGDTVSDLTSPGCEPQTSRTDSDVVTTKSNKLKSIWFNVLSNQLDKGLTKNLKIITVKYRYLFAFKKMSNSILQNF